MYEDQTYDIILERMMNRVSDKIDKRPSSPVYDLHSSTAIEFQILYIELEYLIKNSYGDTAAREFLILLAKDRGLSPEPATKAILQGEFTPTNIDVTGKRFNIGEINYVVTEQITPGTYKVQCETEGVVGNQYLGDMIPMEYIDGLQTASLTSVLIPGEDEEDTEVFRQRYFDSFNEQSFGGNHADYMAKVKGIEGVGSCKVKRVWNGDIRPADMIVSTVVKNWYESIISTVPAAVKPWLDAVYNAAKDKKLTVGGTVHVVIPNKGIHAAYKKLRLAVDTVPEEMIYCLKIDCKKFYPSIDHETLKQKFRRKYKDPELLELIDEVIDSISTCPATDENIEFYRSCGNEIKIVKVNGKDFIEGVGIPIGNYFSQYDGNFFLSGFDHWIKEVKRVKHYYRYMDDICIFARTKEELHQLLAEINEYFIQNLKLRIKGNYQIFPSFIRGIDFVGYRIFLNSTLLRKSTCQEMKRKMTNIRKKVENGQEMNYSEWCSINSYKGWLKHCDSSHLSDKYIVPIQQYADDYYTNHIKAKKKKKGGKKHERVRKSTQYKAA